MKITELRPCANCNGFVAPIGYVVKVSQMITTPQARKDIGGIEMMHGNVELADAMGMIREDTVKILGDEKGFGWDQFFLCQDCGISGEVSVAMLAEQENEKLADLKAERPPKPKQPKPCIVKEGSVPPREK